MVKSDFGKKVISALIFSLGVGVLSLAPAKAEVASHTLTIDAATDTIAVGESATAVLTHQFVALASSDRVQLNAVVTSSNAANAGTIMLSVTDSYTNTANDGTSANAPRYSFGGETFNSLSTSYSGDSVTLGFSALGRAKYLASDSVILGFSSAGETANLSGTSDDGSVLARIRNRERTFLTSNFATTARDSITIAAGATESNTVGVANKNYGTELQLKLYNPTRAGTYTVTVFSQTSNNGAALVSSTPVVTWTVTVTGIAETAAATNSTATLRQNNASALRGQGTYFGGTAEGTDSQTLGTATSTVTDLTPEFTMLIWQKDGTSTNLAKESYTVQVTGEAFVTTGTDIIGGAVASYGTGTRPLNAPSGANTVTGTKYLRMATPVADSPTAVHIWSTGTAGTATITATSNAGVVLGTKTVTFAGKATTLAVTTTTKKVIEAGTGTASTAAFRVTATDSGGRNVPGLTSIVIVSDNIAAIASGSCADASGVVTDGVYSCDLTPVVTSTSGAAAALTVRMPDPAVTTATAAAGPYLTTTYAVTMGGAWKTMVLTTDKASYDPGTAMVVTATLKDASGNTPYDGQAGPTLRANKQLGGTAAGTTITMNAVYDGVSTSQTRSSVVRTMSAETTLFAPAASGAFSISGLDAQTTPTSVSVSATVGDDGATAAANAASDAAAEAIDAANAATDAANLAAEAADAATVAAEEARDAADAATAAVEALANEFAALVASVKAQITTLANTVAKIAKKVKA